MREENKEDSPFNVFVLFVADGSTRFFIYFASTQLSLFPISNDFQWFISGLVLVGSVTPGLRLRKATGTVEIFLIFVEK